MLLFISMCHFKIIHLVIIMIITQCLRKVDIFLIALAKCGTRATCKHSDLCKWLMRCYYIPEKRKFSGILCFRQQRIRRSVVRRRVVRRRHVTISLSAR